MNVVGIDVQGIVDVDFAVDVDFDSDVDVDVPLAVGGVVDVAVLKMLLLVLLLLRWCCSCWRQHGLQ